MKKRILTGILAVSMVGALLAGCGKGASQSTEAAPAAGTEEAAEAPAGTEQEVDATERAKANEIVIGIPQDLDQSLDPHYAVAAGTKEVTDRNGKDSRCNGASDNNLDAALALLLAATLFEVAQCRLRLGIIIDAVGKRSLGSDCGNGLNHGFLRPYVLWLINGRRIVMWHGCPISAFNRCFGT